MKKYPYKSAQLAESLLVNESIPVDVKAEAAAFLEGYFHRLNEKAKPRKKKVKVIILDTVEVDVPRLTSPTEKYLDKVAPKVKKLPSRKEVLATSIPEVIKELKKVKKPRKKRVVKSSKPRKKK